MDYSKMVSDIIANIGGKENVDSVSHCMTRLRFVFKNKSLANYDELKKLTAWWAPYTASDSARSFSASI